MALDREKAAFERERPRLLSEGHAGRYALIRGDDVESVWDTRNDAVQAGYRLFGLEPFFVAAIELEETVHVVPRLFLAAVECHTSPNP